MRRRTALGCAAAAVLRGANEGAPQWLRDAAAQSLPALPAKAPAVVLFDEQTTTVEESGAVVERRMRAIKVLNNEGRQSAYASETYIQKAGKVRDLRAWLMQTDGVVHRYGKDKVVEHGGPGGGILYDEYRTAVIDATADAGPGTVFGFESVLESKTVFTQFIWPFQGGLPVVVSRFRLVLPAGWEHKATTLRHAAVAPRVDGNTFTWELRGLPFIERESGGPSVRSLAPRIAVGYFPPGTTRTEGRIIRNWADVAEWKAELADPQASPDSAIESKVKELTAGASTEWDKLRAISRYVQSLKYVAIMTNSAKGGGYRPHPAAEVFAKAYGDCKDKATLMRAMLTAVGLESRYVSIFSGDRTYADPQWASPHQFNHAILAVKVGSAITSPAVVEAEGIGRLLIFDPTDPDVRLGDLPAHEQGSWALIAGAGGKPLRMPVIPAAATAMRRTLTMKLAEDGGVTGQLREIATGAHGAQQRAAHRELGKEQHRQLLEQWVSAAAPGSTLSSLAARDSDSDEFTLELQFANPRYARRMNQRLLTVRPLALPRPFGPDAARPERQRPLLLDAEMLVEEASLELPPGFTVDEAPEPLRLETPFGNSRARRK
ncbi:MAG: DUF3857 domain-containing protein [Bryobacterales bacterium]|nr:DUF3857 domain-containing protein [Bryobacterales bacterium]